MKFSIMSKPLVEDKLRATGNIKESGGEIPFSPAMFEKIKSGMSNLSTYHEKQQFLKSLYDDEKTAIKLGVFHTPEEVVNFLIEGTDFFLQKYFGKVLSEPGVEILDPCVGTGTFITALNARLR